jgi:PadR family transcriptional regulator, regulatory protein AphA
MTTKSKTRYALLGILSLHPASGYDLKKFCDEAVSQFWNENYAHIYSVLKELEAEGLARKQTEQTDKRPPKNVYYITPKGKKELNNWLLQPVRETPPRYELLLKLVFSTDIPIDNLINKIKQYKEEHIKALDLVKEGEKEIWSYPKAQGSKWARLWQIGVNSGKYSYKATIDWCDETLETLEEIKKESGAEVP